MKNLDLLKTATHLINKVELTDDEKTKLKDILCYLSELRKNNTQVENEFPQLNFILYNASRKLRTFGYNRLNAFTNEIINFGDEITELKDNVIDEFYKTNSGFVLDKAQKEVLDEFENSNEKLFLSAPTSFGKTFLLKEIIYRHHDIYENIVIVLPTVALLMEVTEEIEQFNNNHNLGYSIYNSIYKDLSLSERNIFVLTPERVLRLLAIVPNIEIDFFFFDEIYKIDEDITIESDDDVGNKIELGNTTTQNEKGHRAIAFRLSLYFLLKKCSACYLAGPFIEMDSLHPGFKNMLKKHKIVAKEITFTPTLKNTIDFHGKTFKYSSPFVKFEKGHRAIAFRLSLYFLLKKCSACYLAGPFIEMDSLHPGFKNMLKKHKIVAKEITFTPTLKNTIDFHGKTFKYSSPFVKFEKSTTANKSIDKLVYTAQYIGFSKTNQAIIYCLYPAHTEKHAKEFSTMYPEQTLIGDKLNMFIEHLKNNYGFFIGSKNNSFDNWDFVYALRNQTGIHNGKFPKYFQREIMNLFNNGEMSTLFCTSTIVEGVNTNAKTVVVYNNPSGKTPEGKKFLLLNINGRAGRYQHHFVGNVVYLSDKSLKLVDCAGISLDFKPYNPTIILNDLDIENIYDEDLSLENKKKKIALNFDKQLLPDDVFEQNRLIERKMQERILKLILSKIVCFLGIESASVYDFVEGIYFETILRIWADIGEIKSTQVDAIKYFSINYAKNSYQGVLDYQFKKYYTQEKDEHQFVNETYRRVFRDVKDTIEYQLPRIISLFESLIIRAFEIKQIQLTKPIDLSNIIRFFEIGATSQLGIDMIEKSIPIVTVKKLEQFHWSTIDLESQRKELSNKFSTYENLFDAYEKQYLLSYIRKYCR